MFTTLPMTIDVAERLGAIEMHWRLFLSLRPGAASLRPHIKMNTCAGQWVARTI
jgi:hypothetical protein